MHPPNGGRTGPETSAGRAGATTDDDRSGPATRLEQAGATAGAGRTETASVTRADRRPPLSSTPSRGDRP